MKKLLVLSACVLGLGVSSPAEAMMKKPTNVCEFLQYMDTKIDQLQLNVSQRINQMNTRLSHVENQLNTVQREVNEIKSTLGCFDNSNANTVPQLHTPVAPIENKEVFEDLTPINPEESIFIKQLKEAYKPKFLDYPEW